MAQRLSLLSCFYRALCLSAILAACDDDGANEPSGARDAGEQTDARAGELDADAASQSGSLDGSSEDARPSQPDASGDSSNESDARSNAMDGALDASVLADASDTSDAGFACAVAAPEACNGRDDDCNGQVDERCAKIPFSLSDFAVRGDGARVAVGTKNNRIQMMCFATDGTISRTAFEVAGPENGHVKNDGSPATPSGIDVSLASTQGNIVVTWGYYTFPSTPYDWRVYAAFFDRDCTLVKAPARLDDDVPLPSSGGSLARAPTAATTHDGRFYLIYEHQTAQIYRVLMFDGTGTRTKVITIPNANGCSGGALTRILALDATSGKFAVVCEGYGGVRVYRRYQADGTEVDPAFVTVPGSKPTPTAFHYFGAGYNAAGTLLYFGRDAPRHWILRTIAADGTVGTLPSIDGSSGVVAPKARVTSDGAFLIELAGESYGLALVSPSGELQRTWPAESAGFELDATDRVYISNGVDVWRSSSITVR